MELLTGFTLGFWAAHLWPLFFIVALCLADVILCETDLFAVGTVTLIVGAGLVALFGFDLNLPKWIWSNLGDALFYFVLYMVVGAVYSLIRWYFYLLRQRDELRDRLARWKQRQAQWDEDESRSPGGLMPQRPAKPTRPDSAYAKNQKGRIIGWIGHWPFSLIGLVLGDFLRRLSLRIFEFLRKLYDRMADHVFKEFKDTPE